MASFVFDVDGTLTNVRERIDPKFEYFMMDFITKNSCYICTGSDRPKTIEQLGEKLTNSFIKSFNCSGNHVFENGTEIYRSDWSLSIDECAFLEHELNVSTCPIKTGFHFEFRVGTVNFSLAGRNANSYERNRFIEWDRKTHSRYDIARRFNKKFPDSEAVIGGDTSIDIFKKNHDKAQVKTMVPGHMIFFGDKCYPSGNDYSLSMLAETTHQINFGWKETYEILKNKY